MNERIEQLAEQCWIHTNEPLFAAKSPHWEFDRHKFAELIVRECIRLCDQVDLVGADECIDNIKEHFEVKK